ncbi:HlyD family efflux transporter periplasmic adaptor subunit [Parasphingopyxis lamellibrachiae]|uniref:HlyD family secretion protein n=1 Tax=Parasphingopyxis lamellibrachiae TaxID=680125 RepID=A0A3D9FJ34_9SPHN|nr:HlyD family efflux transporter periplasmic adaptor subunit [Parasphingopyxis lamellibrachiae]RED17805.1 HlyD family secretion protein [Parasphingopyxis lamellibrachiae]
MTKRRVILLAIAAAVVIVVVVTRGFGLFGDNERAPLTLYGNVDIREVDLAFRVGGRIDEISVEEGERVEENELLARLDTRPIMSRVAEANARTAEAEAQLTRLRTGNRAQDIGQARARVSAAQAMRENAHRDYARREGLVETGAISRDLWDQTVAELHRTDAQLAEAQQALSLLREGTRREDIDAAQARLRAARAARDSISIDADDTVLRAANSGTVVTRAQEPGAIIQPGETVLTLSIDRPMRVRAYIAEPDLWRIGPGMAVEVSADGNPKTYRGTIGYISPRAEFTPRSVETESLRTDLVYRLRIIVEDPDEALRQGQPVTIRLPAARTSREN